MALDTTIGGASADSYGTLLAYQAWRAIYYGIDGTEDDTDDEINLLKARKYIDRAYIWRGMKASSTQALQWPRFVDGYVDGYALSSETIPQDIIDAQFEMAYLIQGGATPFTTLENGAVIQKREKVDVIEESTTYSSASRERAAYPLIDGIVSEYVVRKRGVSAVSVPLMRA